MRDLAYLTQYCDGKWVGFRDSGQVDPIFCWGVGSDSRILAKLTQYFDWVLGQIWGNGLI